MVLLRICSKRGLFFRKQPIREFDRAVRGGDLRGMNRSR